MTTKYRSIILIIALVLIGAWVIGCGAAATPAPAVEAPAAQQTEEAAPGQAATEAAMTEEATEAAAAEPTEAMAAEPTEAAAAEPTEAAAAETEAEAPASDALCGLGNGQEATGEPINVGAVVGATGPDDFSSAAKGAAAYLTVSTPMGVSTGVRSTTLSKMMAAILNKRRKLRPSW